MPAGTPSLKDIKVEEEQEVDHSRVEAVLSGMSTEEKVGQMMSVAFRFWKENPEEEAATVLNAEKENPETAVTGLNEKMRACLKKYHFGSFTLFRENCRDAEQTIRLTADIQAANQEGHGIPMLIAADQEGGTVTRLGFGTSGPGSMALAATGNPGSAEAMAEVYGEELRRVGIHVNYAPVLDINNNPNNPVIGVRSFSDDPETVSRFGEAYIRGLHRAGAIATIKHFPGHGNTVTDSHLSLPYIGSTAQELKAFELVPFRAAIEAGADMIMTAHIQYPEVEQETHISRSTGERIHLPATMSRRFLTEILRGEMGFEGVIITDALNMAAIENNFTDEDTIRLTIGAGVDILMLPIVLDMGTFQRIQEMTDTAVRMVKNGEISEERINASVRRILKLKEKYGLLEQTDFTVTEEKLRAATRTLHSPEHRKTAESLAEKALTLLKNDNQAFPISLRNGEKTLILFSNSSANRVMAAEMAIRRLKAELPVPEGTEMKVMVHTGANGDECLEAAVNADHAVLVHRFYCAGCLDPRTEDGSSTALFDRVIDARKRKNQSSVLVSCQLPYDAGRFPEADAILLTYGSSVAWKLPAESGAGSDYVPNLPVALCACFGLGKPSGILPVSIPAVNKQYQLTDEILYFRRVDC